LHIISHKKDYAIIIFGLYQAVKPDKFMGNFKIGKYL